MRGAIAVLGILMLVAAASAQAPSPYAGEVGRGIKALAPEREAGLLAGAGLGYAKAAELNGHAGPKHVLELAAELGLSAEQRAAVVASFERMKAAAIAVGAELVSAEAELDRRFAHRHLDESKLAELTARIGELEGRLRCTHLAAHLETDALLSAEQRARYAELGGTLPAGNLRTAAIPATKGIDGEGGARPHASTRQPGAAGAVVAPVAPGVLRSAAARLERTSGAGVGLVVPSRRRHARPVRPLPFGPERTAATLDYVRERYADPGAESVVFVPRMVVVHWTAISTLRRTWDAFAPETLAGARPDLATAGRVNVSSQFLVGRDGTIFQLLPETVIARHVIGLNRVAIGIENVGGPEAPLTDAQLRANAALIAHLAKKYPTIRYLIGHLEYTQWEGSSLWEERDPGYRTEKTDPGVDFLARLRARLAPLGLLAAEPADG